MIDYKEKIRSVAEKICSVDEAGERYFGSKVSLVPDRKAIIRIIKLVQSVMFPEYFKLGDSDGKSIEERLDDVFCALKRQISACYAFAGIESIVDTESVALSILEKIPQIKASLIKDIQAIYEGDPAAKSPEEIILCYPGFYAISIYRLAHEFYERKIPFISRIMTEFAHEKTGIDIHAGAKIGERFFIDHGTGIVIGETTTIGDNVKVYQGVTLGAKSFEVGEDGNPIKGIKRHPDIGNNCVIYANATILGGKTVIGDGSVIGASVWLTSSVAPGSVVYYGNNVKEMGKNG